MTAEENAYVMMATNLREYRQFVREIAKVSPIRVDDFTGETNICMYCGESWAERSWNQYIEACEKIAENPQAHNEMNIRYAHQHHEYDCLWVRANKLIRGL